MLIGQKIRKLEKKLRDLFKTTLFGWSLPSNTWGLPDKEISEIIYDVTNWVLGFVTAIAVLMLIWGGIRYLASAGDEKAAEDAKAVIKYALYGLIIAGISYSVVISAISWLS